MTDLEAAPLQWTLLLALTALCLSLTVLAQILASHAAAYVAAPREIAQLVEALDATVEENESHDRDLTKVARLEDKVRLGRLLRDIQRGGDDLRELLNAQLVSSGGPDDHDDESTSTKTPKAAARLLWASTRRDLEDRMRRLDMLRMRFLVVYMGIVAERTPVAAAEKQGPVSPKRAEDKVEEEKESELEKVSMAAPAASRIPETPTKAPTPQMLHRALTDEIKKRPPLRRLTTQAIGHHSHTKPGYRSGWAGVVEELQRSPKLKARHALVERSIDSELALSKLDQLP